MTKQGLQELRAFKQLQSVDLNYCTEVRDFDIPGLRAAMPKLEIIRPAA